MASKVEHLPGLAPKRIADLIEARDTYVKHRDARIRVQKKEVDAKETLIQKMSKYKLTEYRFDGKIIVLEEGKTNVKVKADPEAEE